MIEMVPAGAIEVTVALASRETKSMSQIIHIIYVLLVHKGAIDSTGSNR
jgi:hypothetical protein